MKESTGLFSNLKNQNHKHLGWNSCPSVNCVCIPLKLEKADFMSPSTLRQSGYGDVREPRRDKAKLTKPALHLQGAAALSPESLRHVMRLKPPSFPHLCREHSYSPWAPRSYCSAELLWAQRFWFPQHREPPGLGCRGPNPWASTYPSWPSNRLEGDNRKAAGLAPCAFGSPESYVWLVYYTWEAW